MQTNKYSYRKDISHERKKGKEREAKEAKAHSLNCMQTRKAILDHSSPILAVGERANHHQGSGSTAYRYLRARGRGVDGRVEQYST